MDEKPKQPRDLLRPATFDKKGNIKTRSPWMFFGNESRTIWYTPKDNKYWKSPTPAQEMTESELEKFLPYLKWDFDKIVESPEGAELTEYPPSPENIKKERDRIVSEMHERGEEVDYEKVRQMTNPRGLRNEIPTQIAIKQRQQSPDTKFVNRLMNASKY